MSGIQPKIARHAKRQKDFIHTRKEEKRRQKDHKMTGMMELVDKDLKTGTANKFKDLKENMKTGKKEMEDFLKMLKTQHLK